MDSLFSFSGVFFNNTNPDCMLIEFGDDNQYYEYVKTMAAGRPITTMVVANRLEGTIDRCPYFKICLADDGHNNVNLKLQSFLEKIGSPGMNCQFSDAVVIGLYDCFGGGIHLSIPSCLYIRAPDRFDACIDNEIDMACLQPCGINMGQNSLAEIAGISMPLHLPIDVQYKILSYCRSPTAQLIHDELDRLNCHWDVALDALYYQRVWSVSPIFNYLEPVPTVREVMRGVTRPFLAPGAPNPVAIANHRIASSFAGPSFLFLTL